MTNTVPGLVGNANEVEVSINNRNTLALLDTGSTVSTVSEEYYNQYLSDQPIQPLKHFLDIECADGKQMPYLRYVEATLTAPRHIPSTLINCIFLVVPTSKYHSLVPILIGTNILRELLNSTKQQFGRKFLQTARSETPWYLAYRCMILRESELEKHGNRLALVKSAETTRTIIRPNSTIIVNGYVDKETPSPPTTVMLVQTSSSVLPDDLDVTPAIICYTCKHNHRIPVQINNVSTRTVVLEPRATICELQPVNILDRPTLIRTDTNNNISVEEQVKISKEILNFKQQQEVKQFIHHFKDIFSTGDTDIGHTTAIKHRIDLFENTPFKQCHRGIPPSMIQEVKDHLQQLLAAGVIRKSKSPWSSYVVLCRKKDGKLRMCIEFRQLNQRTIKDSYALPRIDELLDSLGGNKYFSVIDMKSGYHQIDIEECHKELTAFTVGPLGFYEFNRMPFGLANSPATYQRVMEDILGDLNMSICLIYLDDVIIFANSYEEHLDRLQRVFQRLREAGFKLSAQKCSLFMEKVEYVGHIVSEKGVAPDPGKIEKVKNWPTPTTPDEVRQFLGFVGYYRKFVKDFSKIARPLNELMPVGKSKRKRKGTIPKPSPNWKWEKEHQRAFDTLKEKLSNPPILSYPDFSCPFELHTDASSHRLGAVLYQNQEGQHRVIAYASRGLTRAERNYPTHKLEFLALKWAVTEKFSDYLHTKFTVVTDNNPLTYVLTSAKQDATGHRWVAALAAYHFDIQYRPGKNNADADAMSRLPGIERDNEQRSLISTETVEATCDTIQSPYVDTLNMSAKTPDNIPDSSELNGNIDIVKEQQKDDTVSTWIEYVIQGRKPKKSQIPSGRGHSAMLRNFDKLHMKDGILIRKVTLNGEDRHQMILPSSLTASVLRAVHDRMGHPGRERTLTLLRDRFYWHGMTADVENWIQGCNRCLHRKTPVRDTAPLVSIRTSQPLELVCMDYLTLETSKGVYQHILVMTDHFTRFAVAVPTRNQLAKTTADAFYNHFVLQYGFPYRIHSDQGANFLSRMMKELCLITGMDKSRTTPYHPMGNGQCERFNRTLLSMLGTLEPSQKTDWKSYVGTMVHSYNCMKHESTGHTPFILMFGREPRIPIDLAFGVDLNSTKTTLTHYIEKLRDRLKESYEKAISAAKMSQDKQKTLYDEKARGAILQPGDCVLVKIVAYDGKHKLADKWEEEPYIITRQPNPEIPVYDIMKESGGGKKRTLHRNLLLPIGHLPTFDEKTETPVPTWAPDVTGG